MVKHRHRRHAAVATLVMSMLSAGPAAAGVCASGAEQLALQTRVVQTNFMVAAMNCGEHSLYNSFVERFRGQLRSQGKVLTAFFARSYGPNATVQLDRFVTRLANLSARQSLDYQGPYCDESKVRFLQVLNLDPTGFTRYVSAQPGANGHGISVCQAQAPRLGSTGPDS